MERWITDRTPSQWLPVYTRANAGEVLPDPASPLSWTFVWEPGVVMGWYDSQISVGTCDPEELEVPFPPVIGLFGGYLYINGSLARLFGVRGPGLSPEMIDAVYFGEHPDVPPYTPDPRDENPAATERLGAWMGQVLMATDLPALRDDKATAAEARASRGDLAAMSDAELLERARSFQPLIRRLFEVHLTVTAGVSIGSGVLAQVAAAMGDPSMALRLVAAVGDVDSAEPSHAMWALSRLDPDSAAFAEGFERFLYDYGSRGPNEWDLRSDTWETRPALALALIDRMRAMGDDAAPFERNDQRAADREALTAQISQALAGDPETLATFQAGLRSAALYMGARERAKTNIIRVLHEIRMALWELGRRHGYEPSLTCMLLADELDEFVADPAALRDRLEARQRDYLSLFELDPPFIVNAVVPPLSQWARRGAAEVAVAQSGDTLAGVPGCPGVAEGRARVVLDPGDPFALEPGDVLIAPITDPAWTPLFVPAAAVVVDVGAPASHAVIVSRELGIPCVVSVQHATSRIPDGAMVRVDGTTGQITVL